MFDLQNISQVDQNASLVKVTRGSGDRMATFLLYVSVAKLV